MWRLEVSIVCQSLSTSFLKWCLTEPQICHLSYKPQPSFCPYLSIPGTRGADHCPSFYCCLSLRLQLHYFFFPFPPSKLSHTPLLAAFQAMASLLLLLLVGFCLFIQIRFLCSFGACVGTHSVDKVGLELPEIIVFLPSKC